MNRRDLLQATGAGVLGTAGFSQVSVTEASSGGDKIWDFEPGDVVISSPTVVGGTVYVGSNDERLYALDAADGTEQWSFNAHNGLQSQILSAPSVVNNTVYFGANQRGYGNVYAVDTADGTKQWQYRTGSRVRGSPTVANGTVYVGNQGGSRRDPAPNLYAIRTEDGTARWSFQMNGNVVSSPTVVDDTVYFGANDGAVHAVAVGDGTEEWSANFSRYRYFRSSVTVVDGTVYAGLTERDGNNLYALDTTDGSVQWSIDRGGVIKSSPTIADGTLYVGNANQRIYAIDIDDGSVEWTYQTGGQVNSSPTVAGNVVYVGSADGKLYALNQADGTERWVFDTETSIRSSPIVVNGVVYVGSGQVQCCEAGDGSGTVYAIDAGVEGSSEGSRVNLGTLGHHHVFAEQGPTGPGIPDDPKPKIDATSIDIDPYPVEQGDNPEIRVIVEEADEVDAILEKTDQSGDPATVTLGMEQEAEDQWAAKDHSVSFDELGWWDLRIEARSGTDDSVILETFEIDDPRDADDQEGDWLIEDQELGFHVFEEVADVAVVVGWFADEDPPTDSEVAELSAWFAARERDTNYYFGSKRGMRSLVGFDLELRLFSEGEVFEVESRGYYENKNDEIEVFMQDLKSKAFSSDTLESYDLWIGTHPGKEVGTGIREKGSHVTDVEGLYAPIRSRNPKRKQNNLDYTQYVKSYQIWNHEIGHAFGFGHPDAIGNQGKPNESHMCVMARSSNRLSPENRRPEDEINPVPPVSTLHYLTKELEFSVDVRTDIPWWPLDTTEGLLTISNQLDYEREDWLRPSKTEVININQEYTDPKFVAGVRSYNIGDQIPVITANTGVFDQTVKYIFESRPLVESNERGDVDWSHDTGALIIYKWEQRESIYEVEDPETEDLQPSYDVLQNKAGQRSITTPGEEIRDELDDGRVVVFQLHDKEWKDGVGNPSGFHTEVKIKKERRDSNTQTVTLDDPTSIPAGLNPSCFAEYTPPSLDLKAIDSEGRIVGITDGGEYVNQIPGAKASGKRVQGTEWINVPEDTDVDFRVSSADVDQFIEDMEQLGALADESNESDDSVSKSKLEDSLTREYGVSQTTYGDNPELVEENGETVVTDTTTRVQREVIAPGDEQEATPRNPFSDVDIVAIYPDTESLVEERVVLTNYGSETIDLTEWQLLNESGNVFVMPEFELDPGQEVAVRTGAGEDTDTDLYRDAEQPQLNPDGGQVQIIDNTGTTVLSVTYNDRGVIEYDGTQEDGDEPSLADYVGSDDLIHLVGLRDAVEDWRDNVIADELFEAVVDAWRTQREIDAAVPNS